MNKGNFEIALVQSTFTNDYQANIAKMKKLIQLIKRKSPKVKFIIFPELCTTGYFLDKELRSRADTVFGDHYKFFSNIAFEQNVYICYGYVEKGLDNKLYNSALFIDPQGKCICNYRKIQLTDIERSFFTPGSDIVIARTEFGNFGLMICWDLAFPEIARELTLQGADVIVAPSAWECPYQEEFVLFGQARAIDNTVFVAACNHIGHSTNVEFFGQSAIYAPNGKTLVSAAFNEQVITVEIDLSERQSYQASFFTMLNERRPDIYEKGASYYESGKDY